VKEPHCLADRDVNLVNGLAADFMTPGWAGGLVGGSTIRGLPTDREDLSAGNCFAEMAPDLAML